MSRRDLGRLAFRSSISVIKRAQFEVSDAIVDVLEVTLGETVRVEAIITTPLVLTARSEPSSSSATKSSKTTC